MVHSEINQAKQKPALWEKIFVIFVLVLATGAIIPLIRKENGMTIGPVQGDLIVQGLWLGIYIITLILLATRLRQTYLLVYQDKLVWLLVGLALLSVLWSVAPALTFRRSIALLGSSAFGIYLATRFSWQELFKLIAYALGLCAVLSLAFILLLPSYGIHYDLQHSGAWRGIYVHKNALGRYMSLAAVTWLLYAFNNARGRIAGLVFFGISIELLFLSISKTSIAIFILLLFPLSIYLYRLGRWRYVLPVIIITLVTASSAILITNVEQQVISVPAQLPEVDLTLTGRTALWQECWDMVRQRPWLGYGYSAFWLGFEEPSGHIWRNLRWEAPNAHNGYLDLWLQLGLVGLVFFIVLITACVFKLLFLLCRRKGSFEVFSLLFILLLLINNISESFILVQNCIFWILYVAVSSKIVNSYREIRHAAITESAETEVQKRLPVLEKPLG
jgi:O-antigen ligase